LGGGWALLVTMSIRDNGAALAELARNEAARLVRLVAEPIPFHEPTKASIARAADRLGWPFGRTADIWHRTAKMIHSWEMDLLRVVIRNRRRRTNYRRKK
jgi:hypothetical protein